MRSLKVLFLVTRDWSNPSTTGGDNTLWENARYLASVGHDVTFVCAWFAGAPSFERVDGINVVRVGGIYSLWFRSFTYWLGHRKERFDVVVAEGFGGSRIPRLVPLYVRAPIISAWHQIHRDLFAAQYPKAFVWPLSVIERLAAWVHRDTFVQAYTAEWKTAFPQLGFKPEKIFIVPVSIRGDWLTTNPMPLGAAPPRIVWIGKLRRYKCPDHVISAMPAVLAAVPDATLTIAGRRDDRRFESYLRRLVQHLNIEKAVDFRLDISEKDKQQLLTNCAAVVVTSAVEGFSIVALEANARGIPVIASSGVPATVVEHGGNGLRYPFGDIDQLSARINEILTNHVLRAHLSTTASRKAESYRWERVGPMFEELALVAADTGGTRRDEGSGR